MWGSCIKVHFIDFLTHFHDFYSHYIDYSIIYCINKMPKPVKISFSQPFSVINFFNPYKNDSKDIYNVTKDLYF